MSPSPQFPRKPPLAVICDFDGTVTDENTGWDLLDAFADDGWRYFEHEHRAGRMSGQDATIAQFALIRAAQQDIDRWIQARAQIARMRSGIREFLEWCQTSAIPVMVASGGVDVYVKPILEAQRLPVSRIHCGRAESGAMGMAVTFDHLLNPAFPGETDLKRLAVLEAQAAGRSVVMIGDGPNDLPAAVQADLVFARSSLLEACQVQGIPHHKFDNFHEILRVLGTTGL